MQSGPSNYYFSYDHLGSVREVTDGSGNVVSRYDYDPYGRLTVNQGVPPRFGFGGYYYHQPSGLSLTRYRAYDPDLGRWGSRDPGGATGIGLYGYSDNDPVNLYDPDGFSPKPPLLPSPLPSGYGPTTPEGQPQGVPGGPWRWYPNPQDARGGKWKIPGKPGPECSWHESPKGDFNPGGRRSVGKDHWDVVDGNRNKQKLDQWGDEVPESDAHPKPVPPGPSSPPADEPFWLPSWGSIIAPIINPCLFSPLLPGCPQAASLGPTDG